MRYPPEHKARARRQLLASAGALAKRDGFAATGVDRFMAEAGATSGAFYAHFGSKAAMFEAVVEQELAQSLAMLGDDPADPAALARFVERYLSLAHVEHPEAGCCLPSLAAEIGRGPEPVRARFEAAMQALHARVAAACADPERAWPLIAQAVGAVLLARAMHSTDSRAALLGAVRRDAATPRR